MTATRTAPILVIGLGCRRGCSAQALRALIEQSLARAGLALDGVQALASIDLKRDEPGLVLLAALLGLGLEVFSAAQLDRYGPQLSLHSAIAYEQTGCFGIAESAALALAEQLAGAPASLLITRQHTAEATFALACARQNPR